MEDQRDNPNIIGSEIIIYQTEDGYTKIDVKFEDETVWLKMCIRDRVCTWLSSILSEVDKKFRTSIIRSVV